MKRRLSIVFLLLAVVSCGTDNPTTDEHAITTGVSGTLVFQSNRTGDFEIFHNSGSGTAITNMSASLFDDLRPSLSFDGKKLLFMSDGGPGNGLYLSQNGELAKISADQLEYSDARISKRGNKIVFVRNYNLFLMNSTGTGLTQLTFNSGDTLNAEPAFSFDDSRIAFTRNIGGGNSDIMIMNGLGGSVENLTNGLGDNTNPAFSPDGTRIVFTRNNHISVLTIATKSVADLMPGDSLHFNGFPVYAPGGNTIAFVSNRTGNMEIFTMSASGKNLTNVTDNKAIDTYPDWSE